MQQFLLRRVGMALLALFALSIVTFALVRTENYETRYVWGMYYRYEKPSLLVQYGRYVQDVYQGNWDRAWGKNEGWGYEQGDVVVDRIPTTLHLASLALLLGTVMGVSVGILAGINRGNPFGRWINFMAFLVRSMPIFWFGAVVVGIAAYFPVGLPIGSGTGLKYIILPAITLAVLPAAVISTLVRSAMVSALESDYVKLARIKGVSEWKIIWKHCLRNVAVSPLLSFGLIGGSFMTALVVTEAIFQWPGVGLLALQAIGGNGYHPILGGVVLVLAGGYILCHLIYDVVRAFLDPRIRYSFGENPSLGESAGY